MTIDTPASTLDGIATTGAARTVGVVSTVDPDLTAHHLNTRSVAPCDDDDRAAVPRGASYAAMVAVMLVLVGAIVAGEWSSTPQPAPFELVLDLVVGAVGAIVVPRMLGRPVAATVLAVVLSAAFPTATPIAATASLWLALRRPIPVAAIAAVGGVGAQLVRAGWRPLAGLPPGWWSLLVVAGYAAVIGWGAWMRAHTMLVASLRERTRRAEADQGAQVEHARKAERALIAREMHDVLAHRLSLLATFAGALEYNPQAPPEQVTQAVGVIRFTAHEALEDLREVIGVLRDDDGAAIETERATERLQPTLADLTALIEESRDAGLAVDIDDQIREPDRDRVPLSMGRTVYRVVQEALTNARKHATGELVHIAVCGQPGSHLNLDIVNGLPPQPAPESPLPGSGTGLVGLAERVQLAGGRLDYGPTLDGEFRVCASLPWSE